MTPAQINRLRWQSRRGTLELDLVLEKFWRRRDLHTLENLRAFSELVSLDDEDLRRILSAESAGRGGDSFSDSPADSSVASAAQKIADILRRL